MILSALYIVHGTWRARMPLLVHTHASVRQLLGKLVAMPVDAKQLVERCIVGPLCLWALGPW